VWIKKGTHAHNPKCQFSVVQRMAFYERKIHLEERDFHFIYVDQTWLDTSYTCKSCWQGPNLRDAKCPLNKGQLLIVVDAGTRNGFAPDTSTKHLRLPVITTLRWTVRLLGSGYGRSCWQHGHKVLQLPPDRPDFNPIKLIWSQLESIVRVRNMTFRYVSYSLFVCFILRLFPNSISVI
jgi:hypothetical protein